MFSFEHFFSSMVSIVVAVLSVGLVYGLPVILMAIAYVKKRKLSSINLMIFAIISVLLSAVSFVATWSLAVTFDISDAIAIPVGIAVSGLGLLASALIGAAIIRYLVSDKRWMDEITNRISPNYINA